jgi:WD40 repeat protein
MAGVIAAQMNVSHRRRKPSSVPAELIVLMAAAMLLIAGLLYLLVVRNRTLADDSAGAGKVYEAPIVLSPRTGSKELPRAEPVGEVLAIEDLEAIAASLCFTPDGRQLLVGGADGVLRLFDLATRAQVWKEPLQSLQIISVQFSPDGRHFITSSGGGNLRLFDFASRKQLWQTAKDKTPAAALAMAHNGRLMASAHNSGAVLVLQLDKGQLEQRLAGHERLAKSVAFSPDDRWLLSGGAGKRALLLWDAQTGSEAHHFSGHAADVLSVAISRDGRYAASGDSGGTLIVWDLPQRAKIKELAAWQDQIGELVFTPDSRRLVSRGQRDQRLRVLDVQRGEPLVEFLCPARNVRDIDLSPDGRLLAASGGGSRSIRVFRLPQ